MDGTKITESALKSNPKNALAFGIIVLTLLLVTYIILRYAPKLVTNLFGQISEVKGASEDIDAEQAKTGAEASYTDQRYNSWASVLESAMYGTGTDEEAIKDVFNQMKNSVDVAKLNSAFGMRKGFLCFTATNLAEWLQGDGMRSEVNNILSAKGIDYSF